MSLFGDKKSLWEVVHGELPHVKKYNLHQLVLQVYPLPALVEHVSLYEEVSVYLFGSNGIPEAADKMLFPMNDDGSRPSLLDAMKQFLRGTFRGCDDTISKLGAHPSEVFLLIVTCAGHSMLRGKKCPPAERSRKYSNKLYIEAMASFHPSQNLNYLSWLLVCDEWQSKGVGTFLLCLIEKLEEAIHTDSDYRLVITTQSQLGDQEPGGDGVEHQRLFFFWHICASIDSKRSKMRQKG